MGKKDNTEAKILNAAQNIFVRKGMDGAQMQEIADEAGINKTLLLSELPIEGKLGQFIEKYIDLLMNNPFLPAFVLKKINRDSIFFASLFKSKGVQLEPIFDMLEKEMDAGNRRRIDPLFVLIPK